jgi:catechol 2,3-dioxygenase-like lactoylglutathione lyase family enzyme
MNCGETIHVGEDQTYLALYTDRRDHAGQVKGRPLNHVGCRSPTSTRPSRSCSTRSAPFGHDDYEPGRRFYFYDWDGIEFELVSYD